MDFENELSVKEGNLKLYKAGLPGFPRNFTRDSIISAILLQNAQMLRDQLIFCARKQGKKKNPHTGEEPGKIFHEYPGVEIRKQSTLYNACDTTALFIIGHKIYYDLTKDTSLIKSQKGNILMAVNYIINHLKEGLFFEDPKFSGAKKFALRVTYWKDSVLLGRRGGNPSYPASFFLAHIQNMHALRCAEKILVRKIPQFEDMKEALMRF